MVQLVDEQFNETVSEELVVESTTLRHGIDSTIPCRIIRVGLLGCGTVGGAVARQIARANGQLAESGIRFELVRALVRDPSKSRRDIPPDLQLTDDANAFLADSYDVVIEALGGLAAPSALIQRILASGTPVVTANKEVVAAHGDRLAVAAERGGTQLRFEAAAIPGVRFLEVLGQASFAGGLTEITGILNGTTQFILSSLDNEGLSIDAACHRAEVLGLAEPDATRDLSGRDAADKLRLILRQAGIETGDAITPASFGVDAVTPQIAADAWKLGGCLRQVAQARIEGDGWAAYVGPAWVSARHAFSRLAALENGVAFRDATGARALYAGVGAGPDVTARALLNDVVAVATTPRSRMAAPFDARRVQVSANIRTPWFVDGSFRRDATNPARISELFGSHGVLFRRYEVVFAAGGVERIIGITFPQDATTVREATKTIQQVAGGNLLAFPAIEDSTHG